MAGRELCAVAFVALMAGVVAACGDDPRVEGVVEPAVDIEPEPVSDAAAGSGEADIVEDSAADSLWVLSSVPEGMRLSEATTRYSNDSDGGSSTAAYSGGGRSLFVASTTGAAAAELAAAFSEVADDDELVVTDVTVGGQAGFLVVGDSLLPDSGPFLYTMVMWPVGGDPMQSVTAYGEFSDAEVLAMAETLVPRPPEVPYRITAAAQADGVGRVELASLWFPGGSGETCFNWMHGTGSGDGCFSPTTTEILVRQNALVAGVALNGETEVVLRIGAEEVTVTTHPTVDRDVRMFLTITADPSSAELT